jgi:hypothetical protein
LSCTAAVLRALTRVTAAAMVLALPGAARAQKVVLEMHPRAGDTLRVTFEHSVTISGAARAGFAAVPASTTNYRLETREIVENVSALRATVLAIVDSIFVGTSGAPPPGLFPDLDRSLQGARIHVNVTADGASTVVNAPAQVDPDLRALIGEMPAVLPAAPVAVGESWTRDLPLPVEGSPGGSAVLRATIHLDSLTESGNLAWISIRGNLAAPVKADTMSRAMESKGSLAGSLVLDRRRGWLLESHATVNVESVVGMPGGGEPLVVRVRVDQTMRVRK